MDSAPLSAPQPPSSSDRAWGVTASLLFFVVGATVAAAVAFGLFYAVKGVWWLGATASAYFGSIGWFVGASVLGLAILDTWSRVKEARRAEPPTPSAVTQPQPGRKARPLAAAAVAGVMLSGNLSLNIAASRIEEHRKARVQQGVDIYKNHDLASLVGQCVRLAILRHASRMPATHGPEKEALEELAKMAPTQWALLTSPPDGSAPDARVLALADAKLTSFVQEPMARALHRDEWLSLLTEWRELVGAKSVSDAALAGAAETVAADFGITLREALKADFESGGKAWAAMQLDIAQQLLNRTPVSLAEGSAQITAALEEIKGILVDDAAGIPALHRVVLDARQAQDEHARDVTRGFDQVVGMLARIQADVTVIKAQTQAGLSNDAINARIKQIDLDPALSMEQKREQMLPLLAMIIDNQPASTGAALTPAPVQQAVERTFATASGLVRFAALARVGLEQEADAIAAEIENATAGFTDAERYDFFVARGDRYWKSLDYWHAATWYAQAMALRADEPDVVVRAARSAVFAPGGPNYLRDLQRSLSWVERCLGAPRLGAVITQLQRAKLRIALALTLNFLGRPAESAAPAREVLEWLALEHDSPPQTAWPLLRDAAVILDGAGQIGEAQSAIDRAMAAAEAAADGTSEAAAMVAAERAEIRLGGGDLQAASADIQRSIEWHERHAPRNERALARLYASRSTIHLHQGALSRAAADIQKSIEWTQTQTPRDDRMLAIRYADRASIRRYQGDLVGAAADIEKSIQWAEAQSPREQHGLAVWRSTRSLIRFDRGDLDGAAEDLEKCIEWAESQSPRDEHSLALWYASRADLRQYRGDLHGASGDIQKSIEWEEAQSSRNDRGLAVLYASRASIRLRLGDLDGAAIDIKKSIDWGEAQSPRDEPRLEAWRALRASILQGR